MTKEYPRIVSQIVDRRSVSESNRSVIRYFISRLKKPTWKTWKAISRDERRKWLRWVIECHQDNRKLYREVMRGR